MVKALNRHEEGMVKDWSPEAALDSYNDVWDICFWLPWVKPSNSPIVVVSRANRYPDMFVGNFDIDCLSTTKPFQAAIRFHVTVSNTAVADPFFDNVSDELDFLAEIVGDRNSLHHRVDLWALANCRFAGSTRFHQEVEESLKRVGEMLAVIQGLGGNRAFGREILSSFQWEVIEVAPNAVGRDYNLSVVWKVELKEVSKGQIYISELNEPGNGRRRIPNSQRHPIVDRR